MTNGNPSIPEVLSLPTSSLVLSMDKLNVTTEHEETSSASSELPSVSSYNSLSSLSSCGNFSESACSQESSSSRPRSIFKSYWENSGTTPSISRARKASPSVTTPATASVSSWDSEDDDDESAANSYERILKRNEGIKTRRRRSIFNSKYQSMPSLGRPYHPGAPGERKIKSTSALLSQRPARSCLRSSSDEGQKTTRPACSSSVSFDCEVSVITYSAPKENWAAEGWSKMFH